jgi:protein SCO1/2
VLASAEATDFALRDQTGRSVSLSAQRGKVVLLTFLYTNCRDVCPRIADTIDAALGRLGAGVDHVRALAVSVDPVGDTPLAVRRFAASHRLRPQFRYLTGTRAELQPVWQAYNVLAEAPPNGAVSHSSFILLIGRSGRPLLYYPPNVSAPVLARDVRRALSSPRQDAS